MSRLSSHRLRNFGSAVLLCACTALPLHAQDWAQARLDKSPRHTEYVTVHNGSRAIHVFVDYPQVQGKAPVVLMIHEIFGLTPWAKEMADEIAAQGYIVVEPDLLSGMGKNGGGSETFPDRDSAVQAVSALDPAQVTGDLNAAADFAKTIPAANGKMAVTGFCWGGGKSFLFATQRPDLSAAFVFYGPPPPDSALADIHAPVYGFYAGDDARISATVPATKQAMKSAGRMYQPVIYPGAGHGFMRAGEAPDATPANKAAREQGFTRLLTLLHTTMR
jgi:carboxymethylenebutenolidase